MTKLGCHCSFGTERPWDISTNGLGQDDPASYLTTSGHSRD